jgi:hypothetical protein
MTQAGYGAEWALYVAGGEGGKYSSRAEKHHLLVIAADREWQKNRCLFCVRERLLKDIHSLPGVGMQSSRGGATHRG